jgi:hypothetical protein
MPRGFPYGRERLKTICHPDRPHKSAGLCSVCWGRQHRLSHPLTPEQRARYNAQNLAAYHADPTRIRSGIMRRMYGLTLDQYDARVASQAGLCAICLRPPRDGRRLAVDHDHSHCPGKRSCGRCVRGLLCSSCNSGLASFEDNPVWMVQASRYVHGDPQ